MSNFAPAAEAATKVITFLAEQPTEVGISEISRRINLNKNMVFRILNSLEKEGWVYHSDQKYGLTLVPFQITSKSLSRMSLSTAAAPAVLALWHATGESTYLGILNEDKVTYIQHFDSTKDVRVAGRIGGEYDLYCSAPGKVLLAYADESFIDSYTSRSFEKRTPHSVTDKKALLTILKEVRKNGYATDQEEFGGGIACVAAPVFDYTGKAIGTVGCSGFTVSEQSDILIRRLLPHVQKAATEISVCLGAKNI